MHSEAVECFATNPQRLYGFRGNAKCGAKCGTGHSNTTSEGATKMVIEWSVPDFVPPDFVRIHLLLNLAGVWQTAHAGSTE
jgi:hypothetical protein